MVIDREGVPLNVCRRATNSWDSDKSQRNGSPESQEDTEYLKGTKDESETGV